MKIYRIIALGTLLFSCKEKPRKAIPCQNFSKICEHDKDYQLFKVLKRPNVKDPTFMMEGSWYVRQSSDNSFTLMPYGGDEDILIKDTLGFLDKYFYPKNTHKVFKRDTVDNIKIQYNGKDCCMKCEVLLFGPNTVYIKPDTVRNEIFCNKFYIKPLPQKSK